MKLFSREQQEITEPMHDELPDNDDITGISWLAENVQVKAELERLRAEQQNRQQEEQQQTSLITGIKEEISWYTHEFEKGSRGDASDSAKQNAGDTVDLCDESDDDVIIDEPIKKRHRSETEPTVEIAAEVVTNNAANTQHLSRGQQLCTDLLSTKKIAIISI